jgi:hypothetical protein
MKLSEGPKDARRLRAQADRFPHIEGNGRRF